MIAQSLADIWWSGQLLLGDIVAVMTIPKGAVNQTLETEPESGFGPVSDPNMRMLGSLFYVIYVHYFCRLIHSVFRNKSSKKTTREAKQARYLACPSGTLFCFSHDANFFWLRRIAKVTRYYLGWLGSIN